MGVIFYYLGVSAWSYWTLRRRRVEAQRQLLHLRARTLAVEFRRRMLKDPEFARQVLERRLGVKLEGKPEEHPDSLAPRPEDDGENPAP